MNRLGTAILSEGGWEGQLVEQVESLDDLSDHGELRLLVTLSYVVHQSNVTEEDVSAWAGFIANQAHEMEMAPEVLITTAASNHPSMRRRNRTHLLKDKIAGQGVRVSDRHWSCPVDQRFPPRRPENRVATTPDLFGNEIAGRWRTRRPGYHNVSVCHWRVSSDRRDPPSPSGSW